MAKEKRKVQYNVSGALKPGEKGMRLPAQTLSRTVRNNTLGVGRRTFRHGKSFDSLLEADFYTALLYTGIQFEWQSKVTFYDTINKKTTVPLFRDRGMTSKKLYVDFVFTLDDGITRYVDTKGSIKHAKDKSRIKYDLLKHKLYVDGRAHDSCIVWIETSHVKDLLKLAKLPDKSEFWAYFKSLPHY